MGAIRKFVTDSVLRAQAMAGKKFTDAEVRDSVGRLFLEQGTLSHWYRSDQSQQLLTMQAGDIPGDVRKAIKADFAKLGVSAPTDAQSARGVLDRGAAVAQAQPAGGPLMADILDTAAGVAAVHERAWV